MKNDIPFELPDISLANSPELGLMKISDSEFNSIRSLVYEKFGISLSDQKKSLIIGRLQGCIRKRGMTTFQEYIDLIHKDKTGELTNELINQVSTNHTFFFRESDHFNYLSSKVLPEITTEMRNKNDKDLRIWCAACSSGEEAYTLQMTIMECLKDQYKNLDAGLLATDISEKVLAKARAGKYPAESVEAIDQSLRTKYFDKNANGEYQIKDFIKKEILFRRFNLMNKTFPFGKPFHVVFCRNVMIYFDEKTRSELVEKIYNATAPGGYLFVGHSESLNRSKSKYEYIMPAVYKKCEK